LFFSLNFTFSKQQREKTPGNTRKHPGTPGNTWKHRETPGNTGKHPKTPNLQTKQSPNQKSNPKQTEQKTAPKTCKTTRRSGFSKPAISTERTQNPTWLKSQIQPEAQL